MHYSKRQQRALRKTPYYQSDIIPQTVHRYKCWQLFAISLVFLLVSLIFFIISFSAGLPAQVGQLFQDLNIPCNSTFPKLFYMSPLSQTPYARVCIKQCPTSFVQTVNCNSSNNNCQLLQSASYSTSPGSGVTIYNSWSLYGACLVSDFPYNLQQTLLSNSVAYWLQNDMADTALIVGLTIGLICLGIYFLALLITCIPAILIALVPIILLSDLFIIFYILIVQEVDCGSVINPTNVSPYASLQCTQYRAFAYLQLGILAVGLTVIVFKFQNLKLSVLLIRGLSPFFSGYIWQLNLNFLVGLVYLLIPALYLLNLNQLLQMPQMKSTSMGPFAATDNWTQGWAPIFQLCVVLFFTDYILNFVQLLNANVTALWYFEESAEMAVHQPLLRSLKRSFKRIGVLAITTIISPLVLLTEILYWLFFSGRPLDSASQKRWTCIRGMCNCCLQCLDVMFGTFNRAGISLLAIFDLGAVESNQRAYVLHKRFEFKVYGAGTQIHLVSQLSILTVINIAGYFLLEQQNHYSPVALLMLIQLVCCSFCQIILSHFGTALDTVLDSILIDIESEKLDEHCPQGVRGMLRDFMDEMQEELLNE